MPNWCSNDLLIEGEAKDVFNFFAALQIHQEYKKKSENPNDSMFSFAWFIPPPEDYTIEWCIENWGSKWDVVHAYIDYHGQDMKHGNIWWESAWGPHTEGVYRLSKLFKSLTFTLHYFEPGCGFDGRFQCSDGFINEDHHFDVKEDGVIAECEIFN